MLPIRRDNASSEDVPCKWQICFALIPIQHLLRKFPTWIRDRSFFINCIMGHNGALVMNYLVWKLGLSDKIK